MRKAFIVAVMTLTALLCPALPAFADDVEISGSDVSARPGETVEVEFSFSGVPEIGIGGFQMDVVSPFGIVQFSRGAQLLEATFEPNPSLGRVVVISSESAVESDGVVFVASVAVPADAKAGKYTLGLDVTEIFDNNLDYLTYHVVPATIVVAGAPAEPSGSGSSSGSGDAQGGTPTDSGSGETPEGASGDGTEPEARDAELSQAVLDSFVRYGSLLRASDRQRALGEGEAGSACLNFMYWI